MATTKKRKPRQKRIAGTEDGDVGQIRDMAELYADLVHSRMQQQEAENVNRREVIAAMQEAGIDSVSLDDGRKVRLKHIEADDKLKIERPKKGWDGDGDDDD